MSPQTLFDLLDHARNATVNGGIASYLSGNLSNYQHVSYTAFVENCWKGALALQQAALFRSDAVVLIHFNDHFDNLTWFWSTLLSGCTPAMSSPLPNDLNQRRQHLQHLNQLLEEPICLTRQSSLNDFAVCPSLSLLAIEDLKEHASRTPTHTIPTALKKDLAALVLTSGSTGNAKAVCLTHQQILASLTGKDSITDLAPDTSLLNWIGLDHVAALVETHLLAMYRGLDQVHVQAEDVVAEPLTLLHLITKHRVSRTVAPNFLLAGLQKAIARAEKHDLIGVDLSTLTQLVSGGEANPVELCVELDQSLQRLGAKEGVIQSAFGMTETCAGCTYNIACPIADVEGGVAFASLGFPVGGLEIRVVREVTSTRNGSTSKQRGALQIRGPQVFSSYYRNPGATAEAFTADGWFDTGDEAMIDSAGNLHLVGRIKDQIRINGISIVSTDVETHLNSLCIEGAVSDFYACFGYRATTTGSEQLAVLYLPAYSPDDEEKRSLTNAAIAGGVVDCCRVTPFVLPLDEAAMQKSTLGKLSRTKLRRHFEAGMFKDYVQKNTAGLISNITMELRASATETEARLLTVVRRTLKNVLDTAEQAIQLDTPWYGFGLNSIHLIRLKHDVELAMDLADVPLLWLLNISNIREFATRFEGSQRSRRDSVVGIDADSQYDPIARLHSHGSKPPIWFFHPGVGEVLIFMNLARLIKDRPVYALRARGFNPDETFFKDIDEAVDTYFAAIKSTQPTGPYILAGYSYGAMLAFETAKRLNEAGSGQEVQFLASLNLPPHIKFRMQQLDWTACALHLACFLGILSQPRLQDQQNFAVKEDLLDAIFQAANFERLVELSLTPKAFAHWASLAHAMQSMARDYEPSGIVAGMDVFYCDPLAVVAKSKQEWMENHIGHWKEFSNNVRFHEVGGEHYTMIGAEHVQNFSGIFMEALNARGL